MSNNMKLVKDTDKTAGKNQEVSDDQAEEAGKAPLERLPLHGAADPENKPRNP